MEYCCHLLAVALDCYFDMMEQIQKQIHGATVAKFADSLALQEIIKKWSVLVIFQVFFLDHTHLSQLNDICAMSLLFPQEAKFVQQFPLKCNKSFQAWSRLTFCLCASLLISCLLHYYLLIELLYINYVSCIDGIAFH